MTEECVDPDTPTEDKPVEKPKRAKANPEHKQFLNDFVDILLKPTRRRLNFMYPALCRPDERLVVLGTNPSELVFGNPAEGLCLVQFHNQELFDRYWSWLLTLGMDINRIEAIDVGKIAAALSKVKGDWTQITTSRHEDDLLYIGDAEKPSSVNIYSLFTMMRFQSTIDLFKPIITQRVNGVVSYPIEIRKDVPTIQRYELPKEMFYGTPIEQWYPGGVRIVAARGYDLLCAEHIKDEVKYNGLKLWLADCKAVLYAAVIDTDRFTMLCCRCNVFLIPM